MLKLTSTLLAALVLFAGSAPLSVNAQTSDDKTALKKSFEEKSFDIAERYFRRGKWRNAVDGYEKALPSYNQDSGIFYRLVVACSELGEARKTVLYGAGFNYLAPAHEFTDRLNAMVQKAKESLARAKVEPAVLTFEIAPRLRLTTFLWERVFATRSSCIPGHTRYEGPTTDTTSSRKWSR